MSGPTGGPQPAAANGPAAPARGAVHRPARRPGGISLRHLAALAWRDLRGYGRSLWVLCACLALGVTLVAAGGALFQQVNSGLQNEARSLFGGDVVVRSSDPLPEDEAAWIAARGTVSRSLEMRTMLANPAGSTQLASVQSVDATYPLYGEVELAPAQPLAQALARRDDVWGVALDPILAERLGVGPGDRVEIGDADYEVRATIVRQPDRSLRADWAGAPVLLTEAALRESGLVQPLSRIDYDTRLRLDAGDVQAWRADYLSAFPDSPGRVRTFSERSERIAEVLGQVGTGLIVIGLSALFIGGLGVYNSVRAYLQGRLAHLATLRALGLRERAVAGLVLIQVLTLGAAASLAGTLLGGVLAWIGAARVADNLPVDMALATMAAPLGLAFVFGILTALTFALPPIGQAVGTSPAVLLRGNAGGAVDARMPAAARWLSAACALAGAVLIVLVLPDRLLAVAFLAAVAGLLLVLEAILAGLRRGARAVLARPGLRLSLPLRLALANLQRRDASLRAALLSLGTALTLIATSTIIVLTLLRTLDTTVPDNAPALVMYDIQSDQRQAVTDALQGTPGFTRVQLAPFVLGRIVQVRGESLRDSADDAMANRARSDQKLSTRAGNIDDVVITSGAWWPQDYAGTPVIALEDREAERFGLGVGDTLRLEITGQSLDATVAAIYAQRGMQSRLWLEGVMNDGALDPYITRYVGAAYLDDAGAVAGQDAVTAAAPNVVSVRTGALLDETRSLMARAGAGIAVIAAICLAASLLVLAGVVAASRARQAYDATVLHTLGLRLATVRRMIACEYAVLGAITTVFAGTLGALLAWPLLVARMALDPQGLLLSGAVVAAVISAISLAVGARHVNRRLKVSPARLLRSEG